MQQQTKKVFDSVTAKKIISEYAEKLNYYMKENQTLSNHNEDLKMTLKINKDLLFKYISSNLQQSEQLALLEDYKNESLRLQERNEVLYREKTDLEKKLYKFQNSFDDNSSNFREEIDKLKEQIFLLKNKNEEKDHLVALMRKDIEHSNNKTDKQDKKIYLSSEPTKINIELNNELCCARELVSKMSKLLNAEKTKIVTLENKLKSINNSEATEKNQDNTKTNNAYEDSLINISSSFDSLSSHISINSEDLKSPGVKFPDKVNQSVNLNISLKPDSKVLKKSNSFVPKLDFKIIQTKYQSENMKPVLKDNKKKTEVMGKASNDKKQLDEANLKIQKLNEDLNKAKETIKELKEKAKKYRNAYEDKKMMLQVSEENLKNCNTKVESLESQIKKLAILMPSPSTDDMSNKRVENSTGRSVQDLI